MPHLSKRKVDQKIFEEIYKSFSKALAKSSKNYSTEIFSGSFFTKTERIMFAKRLAVIVLLYKKYPFYKIVEMLKVSPSTVARFENKLNSGKYQGLIKVLGVKTQKEKMQDSLEKILRGGLPKMDRSRWENI